MLPTGPITGVRIGIADYASVAGNTPLPSEVLGLTKIGTVDKAGPSCYITYINRTVGITRLVVESTTKGIHFLQFVLSDGKSYRYGR